MKTEAWTEPRAYHEEEVLRWADVHRMVKLSRNTVRKLEKAGQFPKRFPLTDYSVGWRKSDVLAWIAALGSKPAAARTA